MNKFEKKIGNMKPDYKFISVILSVVTSFVIVIFFVSQLHYRVEANEDCNKEQDVKFEKLMEKLDKFTEQVIILNTKEEMK